MKVTSEIRLPARLESLHSAVAMVRAEARQRGIAASRISSLELAVEEAVVNICHYAYPAGDGVFEIRCISDNSYFFTEIIDHGISFDITSLPDPDITIDIEKRQTGGLGVYFIKKFIEDVKYRREGDKNILRLGVSLK